MATGSGSDSLRAFTRNYLAATLALMIGMQGTAMAASTQSGNVTTWATTHTHAFNTTDATFNAYATDQEPASITVALKLQNKDVLDSYIHELFQPGSPSYHKFLTNQESTANFAPTQRQAQEVADYLTKQGYTNVRISANRLLVTADGTASTARNAFHTEIGHFTRHGHNGIANMSDIQVPATLTQVDRVLGLQTLVRPEIQSRPGPSPAYTLESTTGNPTAHAYYPQEFATVYDAGNTPAATNTTVGIIGWGNMTNTVADLNQFESDQNISPVPTEVVTVGGATSDDSDQKEWAMDAQAIVGISGGVKQLIFYASGGTNDSTDSSLLQTINQAVSDNTAKVINMSWGLAECLSEPGAFDSPFELGVAQGQTFSASSGDNGSYPCPVNGVQPSNGSYGDTTAPSVNYPASSPYVVAIGGTTLNTTTSDVYTSETTWQNSGGGISGAEPTPVWQPSTYSHRELPDLAFNADWTNSPIIYYLTASTNVASSGYYMNGGTSLASPLFVGAWARLETANNNEMGFAAPLIYAHASGMPFHDVTTGSNGYYSAIAGWDNTTGWGSFDIAKTNSYIAQSKYWARPNIVPILTTLLLQ